MEVPVEDPEEKPTPKHKRKSRKKKKKQQKSNQKQDTDENPESRKQQDLPETPEPDSKEEPRATSQQTSGLPVSGNADVAIERLSFNDFVIRQNRISDRRVRVFKGRQNLQAKRLALRHLRLQATELESPLLAMNEQVDGLSLEAVKRIQAVRRKISEDEFAYDRDERAVTIDENALITEEYQLFRDFARSLFPKYVGSSELVSIVANSSKEPPTIPPAPRVPLPLYEYDSKIGEANIVRETLEQLDDEWAEYLEKQQQGLDLDADELEFLESYERLHQESQDRLRALEKDIRKLEPAADETGLLSPSERYIPQLAVSAPTSPLTLPGTTLIGEPLEMGSLHQITAQIEGLAHEQQDHDAISEMSIDLNDPALATSDDAPGFRFDTTMDGWLAQLPRIWSPISKSAGKAVAFDTREGFKRLRQYIEHGARRTLTKTISVQPSSCLPGCEDWILVNMVRDTDPNVPIDCDVQNLINPEKPELQDSKQSQNYRKALTEFPELDLASSTASLSRRQAGTPDNDHKCSRD